MWLSLAGVRVLLLQLVQASCLCNLERSIKQRNFYPHLCLSVFIILLFSLRRALQSEFNYSLNPHILPLSLAPYCSIFLQPDEYRMHLESLPVSLFTRLKGGSVYNCLFLFFNLWSRECYLEKKYHINPTTQGGKKKFSTHRSEQKCSNLIHRFLNAAKPYVAKRKSRSVSKSQFSHILNLYIALKSYNVFHFFYYPGHLLKDYSTVSHKAQTRYLFIYKNKTKE